MEEYQTRAYAKINLGLDVVKRLPNGYHQVEMIMQNIGIYDELTFEKAEKDITISTDSRELPTDENNLICRAARYMFARYGISSGLRVRLRKNIPVAAGLAGGSTDAAAAIKAVNSLFGLNLPLSRLMEDGTAIGADVPYCILGGTALAEGIGERLTPLPALPPCHILVAKPDISVSTKYVYEHLDLQTVSSHPDIRGMAGALREGSLEGVVSRMGNVLETVTVPAYLEIASLKSQMLRLGAAGSLMSGSGPTVFGIFSDPDRAQAACSQIAGEGLAKQVFLTQSAAAAQKPPVSAETIMLQERYRY